MAVMEASKSGFGIFSAESLSLLNINIIFESEKALQIALQNRNMKRGFYIKHDYPSVSICRLYLHVLGI